MNDIKKCFCLFVILFLLQESFKKQVNETKSGNLYGTIYFKSLIEANRPRLEIVEFRTLFIYI